MEDDQQFCLRWNNHQSTLVAVFDTLLENGTLVDCTLAAEGKYLNAHKVVLSACSPYFESLLAQNYDKHPIFILKDVKFQELKAMMDYMYRGEVNISQDQLGALLKAAESLQIKGLSDNKKDSEPRKSAPPPPAKSPPPMSSTLPRVQGLTIEQRRANRSVDEREGSLSPGPRKRKRVRRRSTDDLDNHHDASNSSESHSNPTPNIPIALPPASSSKLLTADVPEPVETKSEIMSRHKIIPSTNEPEIPQVPIIKEKLETHSELMLEPKAEYVEEMNEDSIEDLTLDDDDVSNLDMSNDGAGPSHGNAGEGSSQGFGGWHMGNQSQDEVFLAAQEAVGAHRDSQGLDKNKKKIKIEPSSDTPSKLEEISQKKDRKPTGREEGDEELFTPTTTQQLDVQELLRPLPIKELLLECSDSKQWLGTEVSGMETEIVYCDVPSSSQSSSSRPAIPHVLGLNPQLDKICEATNQSEVEIIKFLWEIKEQNKTILSRLHKTETHISNAQAALLPDDFPNLPCNFDVDLDILENYLEDKDNLRCLIHYLSQVGGKDVVPKVNAILRKCMSNQLASTYSFLGSRLGKKAFGSLHLKDAVVAAVKSGTTVDNEVPIIKAIKEWLKHAPQRVKLEDSKRTRDVVNN